MGLARKGSRKIVVEQVEYRWVVSADDGFMRIVVEKGEGPGQRLSVQLGDGDEGSPTGASMQTERITPALIRWIVLRSRSLGWTPDRRGRELCLRIEGGEILPLR